MNRPCRLSSRSARICPGGFFIYKASAPEELLYVNKATIDIFGCDSLEDFKKLTGFTFKGMLHPEDYAAVSHSIVWKRQATARRSPRAL